MEVPTSPQALMAFAVPHRINQKTFSGGFKNPFHPDQLCKPAKAGKTIKPHEIRRGNQGDSLFSHTDFIQWGPWDWFPSCSLLSKTTNRLLSSFSWPMAFKAAGSFNAANAHTDQVLKRHGKVIWPMQNRSLQARLISSLEDTGNLRYNAVLILLYLLIKSYKAKSVTFDTGCIWHNWQSQQTDFLTAAGNTLTTLPHSPKRHQWHACKTIFY